VSEARGKPSKEADGTRGAPGINTHPKATESFAPRAGGKKECWASCARTRYGGWIFAVGTTVWGHYGDKIGPQPASPRASNGHRNVDGSGSRQTVPRGGTGLKRFVPAIGAGLQGGPKTPGGAGLKRSAPGYSGVRVLVPPPPTPVAVATLVSFPAGFQQGDRKNGLGSGRRQGNVALVFVGLVGGEGGPGWDKTGELWPWGQGARLKKKKKNCSGGGHAVWTLAGGLPQDDFGDKGGGKVTKGSHSRGVTGGVHRGTGGGRRMIKKWPVPELHHSGGVGRG